MISKTIYLVVFSAIAWLLPACMKPAPETTASAEAHLRHAIPAAIIVLLVETPDPESHLLTLQNYFRDGQSFIPIFRSQESFQRSTHGAVNKPVYQIDRRLFVSMLHGPETVILDAATPDEIVTSGDVLKRAFPEPFDPSSR